MQALDVISAEQAINAMQSINLHVRNAWFALVFFGAPATAFVALMLHWVQQQWQAVAWAALSCVAIATTVAITVLFHLPWNDGLAGVVISAATQESASIWSDYSTQWTAANHGRTTASFLAFVAMLFALLKR